MTLFDSAASRRKRNVARHAHHERCRRGVLLLCAAGMLLAAIAVAWSVSPPSGHADEAGAASAPVITDGGSPDVPAGTAVDPGPGPDDGDGGNGEDGGNDGAGGDDTPPDPETMTGIAGISLSQAGVDRTVTERSRRIAVFTDEEPWQARLTVEADASVSVEMPEPRDMEGTALGPARRLELTAGDDGTVTFGVADEGLYALDDMVIVVESPHCPRQWCRAVSVGDALRDCGADAGYDAVVLDRAQTPGRSVTVELSRAVDRSSPGSVSSDASYYVLGEAQLTFHVTDRWFGLVQGAAATVGDEPLDVQATLTVGDSMESLEPCHGVQWRKDGDTWTGTCAAFAVQGRYDYRVAYAGFHGEAVGACHPVSPRFAPCQFLTDWQGPQADASQVDNPSSLRWVHGWAVAESGVRLRMPNITDSGSGVEGLVADSAMPVPNSTSAGPLTVLDGDDAVMTMTGDGTRLALDGSAVIMVADRAGNVSRIPWTVLRTPDGAEARGIIIDDTAPALAVEHDGCVPVNGWYCSTPRTTTVTLEDGTLSEARNENPDLAIGEVSRGNGVARTLTLRDCKPVEKSQSACTLSIRADAEGTWRMHVRYADPMGRQANADDLVVIDSTAPRLTVESDDIPVGGEYYGHARFITVVCVESHVGSLDVRLADGDSQTTLHPHWIPSADRWTAVIPIAADGRYELLVDAVDLAGNVAQRASSGPFVIDATMPGITIDGVEDSAAYADVVEPHIVGSDANLSLVSWSLAVRRSVGTAPDTGTKVMGEGQDPGRLELTVPDMAHDPESDGIYDLVVRATDKAGNVATRRLTFSVNRFGSTYELDGSTRQADGSYLTEPPTIRIVETNVSGLAAGTSDITVSRNSDARTLSPGEYNVVTQEEANRSRTTYTLPAGLFAADGYYRVIVSSTDRAGNYSTNLMDSASSDRSRPVGVEFAVDSTPPVVSLSSIPQGGSQGLLMVSDNMALSETQVVVDGRFSQWNGDEGNRQTVTVPSDSKPHDVRVEAVDRAGNRTVLRYPNVSVAPSWSKPVQQRVYWRLWGMALGSLVGVAVITCASRWSWRRKTHRESDSSDAPGRCDGVRDIEDAPEDGDDDE
ncbi:MAG: Ig-like domain repeat protein [Bifidobacteriaceae bacterium]|nr:Ig-like domain repeat protein [Bifidobacteriaceae bacterium]